jgi:hypothetical protein
MFKLLATLSVLLPALPCSAGSLLEGEWQSDHGRTRAFIEKHVKLEQRTLDFHRSSFGRLKLTFAEGMVRSFLPDHEVTILGKVFPMVGFDEAHSYSVLLEDAKVVVVRSFSPVTGTPTVGVFNFESRDVMWIYIGGEDEGLSEMHLREYFSRLPDEG